MPRVLAKGARNVLNGGSTEPGEEHDEKHKNVAVVQAMAALARFGVPVRQGEELGGIRLSFKDEVVGEQKQREQVESEAS